MFRDTLTRRRFGKQLPWPRYNEPGSTRDGFVRSEGRVRSGHGIGRHDGEADAITLAPDVESLPGFEDDGHALHASIVQEPPESVENAAGVRANREGRRLIVTHDGRAHHPDVDRGDRGLQPRVLGVVFEDDPPVVDEAQDGVADDESPLGRSLPDDGRQVVGQRPPPALAGDPALLADHDARRRGLEMRAIHVTPLEVVRGSR